MHTGRCTDILYSSVSKEKYDKKIKLSRKITVPCYTVKEFDEYKKKNDTRVVGEALLKNKKEEIARLQLDDTELIVSEYKGHKRLLYKEVGFVHVGGTEYVALLKSRLPFWLMLLTILLLALLLAGLLSWYFSRVPVIGPYNPLPVEDPKAEEIPDDDGTPVEQDGGAVSLVYSLDAQLNLSTGKIEIYFQNPGTSNHDVVLQMYVVSGGSETLIAESGRIAAGKGLYELSMNEKSAVLSEGLYDAKLKVIFYNPSTGEKALVESDITDVTLTVTG